MATQPAAAEFPGRSPEMSLLVADADPRFEGHFISAQEAQHETLVNLPAYPVTVLKRRTHKESETDEFGTYHQETVRYSDGAVRLVTLGVPHDPVTPDILSSGDPWLTGHEGFNNIEIKQLVRNGFTTLWNHHHGRHATLPTSRDRIMTTLGFLSSKSIGRSAAHDHALLDDFAPNADFDTGRVIRKGYSRSAMAGEAFIAQSALAALDQAEDEHRQVVWSDLEGECFSKGVGVVGLFNILTKQVPHEVATLASIAKSVAAKTPATHDGKPISIEDFLGTLDLHPLNLSHEIAWIQLLIRGDAGMFANAVPLDARGIRTIYEHDYMAQESDQVAIHSQRPHLQIVHEPGSHLSGASPEMLAKKDERYRKLGQYIREHGNDLSNITAADVLPEPLPEEELLAA